MKKTIILILSIYFSNISLGQNLSQVETSLNNKKNKSSIYKEHKKQMMEINKQYQSEKKVSDKLPESKDVEFLLSSNGKLIKKIRS